MEKLKVELKQLQLELKKANDAITAHDDVLVSLLEKCEEEGGDDDQSNSGSGFDTNDSCT